MTQDTRSLSRLQSICTGSVQSYEPFSSDISATERIARLCSLRTAVLHMFRSRTDLIDALTLAEDGDPEWLERAHCEVQCLPALHRRQLLAAYTHYQRGA
jgi:hypothetical protein